MARKHLAGLALVAGLAGGGVAGALFGAPGTSGAQEAPTTTAPADTAPLPEGRGGPGGCFGGGHGLDAAATALGMTDEELRTELQAGKTIAQVAQAENVDVQKVIDAMVAATNAHIDQAVADGRLTQAEADAKKADVVERTTTKVNEGRPAKGDRPARPAA
ncbi:MAG: hypothetical protein QOG87_1772 [Actinomycetota bacterium]|jgi:hypothetical protein